MKTTAIMSIPCSVPASVSTSVLDSSSKLPVCVLSVLKALELLPSSCNRTRIRYLGTITLYDFRTKKVIQSALGSSLSDEDVSPDLPSREEHEMVGDLCDSSDADIAETARKLQKLIYDKYLLDLKKEEDEYQRWTMCVEVYENQRRLDLNRSVTYIDRHSATESIEFADSAEGSAEDSASSEDSDAESIWDLLTRNIRKEFKSHGLRKPSIEDLNSCLYINMYK